MFDLHLSKSAFKYLSKSPFKDRVTTKLHLLAQDPYRNDLDIKKLANMLNYFRLRIGNIRIIYYLDNPRRIIQIVEANNRGEIY